MYLALVVALIAGAFVLALPHLRQRAESVSCGNQMASIALVARFWAEDHDHYLPTNFLCLSNELSTPRLLTCPSDHASPQAVDWSSFGTANSSYEIVSPRVVESDTNSVFFRCKVHGHLGYGDGTVFDGKRRRTKVFW